jgi:glycyl-tRNA synthetase beta chain
MNKNKDAVLEIGCEEIPAVFLPAVLPQLKTLAGRHLSAFNISVADIVAWNTPRRLVLYLKDLPAHNNPLSQEIIGPAAAVGIKEGHFSIAAKGFAQRYGMSEKDLQVKDTPKGKYLFLTLTEKPLPAEKILQEVYPKIISALVFAKNMVWEKTGFRFARPIRWLLALYDDKVVRFSLAGITSGRFSRALAPGYSAIKINSARHYLTALRNHNIIVDNDERLAAVQNVSKDAERTLGKYSHQTPETTYQVRPDEELLSEINYLVECPTAVVGKFPPKYLDLPQEIISICLKSKQKFFAVDMVTEGKENSLSNYFVGIRNGPSLGQDIVRDGFERVLAARLEDAEFYFRNDSKSALVNKSEKLGQISLIPGLGTVAERVGRIKLLADWLNQKLKLSLDAEKLHRAIGLIKADLTTQIVGEYPQLQGVAGRIYARLDKEEPEICAAIEQHYWPLTANGTVPQGFSAVIALADKVETLVGYWSVGIKLSGSGDPFALRRMVVGILRIIRHNRWMFSLTDLIDFAIGRFKVEKPQLRDELMSLLISRLEQMFIAEGRWRCDTIRSVLKVRPLDVVDCEQRLAALEEARKIGDWENIEVGFKRANNILRQSRYCDDGEPDTGLFNHEAERELENVVREIQQASADNFKSGKYLEFWRQLVRCRPAIDRFFRDVLVMDKDEKVRRNRLALLRSLVVLVENVADLTLLVNDSRGTKI